MAKGKAKAGPKGVVAALERSPSHLLHCVLQLALDLYAQELGADGLTQRQYAVLAAVAAREGATQSELVRLTGVDRSTLADIAARLIAKGLLARERSAIDARANAVRLTEAGQAALAAAEPRVEAADARLLRRIQGGKRRAAFLEMLRDIRGVAAAPLLVAPKPAPVKPAKAGKPNKRKKKVKAAA